MDKYSYLKKDPGNLLDVHKQIKNFTERAVEDFFFNCLFPFWGGGWEKIIRLTGRFPLFFYVLSPRVGIFDWRVGCVF